MGDISLRELFDEYQERERLRESARGENDEHDDYLEHDECSEYEESSFNGE